MKLYKALLLATCAATMFAGCNNDDPGASAFDNKVYISTTEKNPMMLLRANIPSYTQTISAAIPRPMNKQVELTYKADESRVENYTLIYGEQAIVLPAENYELVDAHATIAPGAVKSTDVTINFKNLTVLDRSQVYVLPVVIDHSANVAILESGRTIYYVFRGAALINVVGDIAENYLDVNWKNKDVVNNLSQLTMEALVRVRKFDRTLSTVMGIEGKFLLRIGDAPIHPDQVQLATGSGNLVGGKNENLRIPTNEWVHIAVTYDYANSGYAEIFINGKSKANGNVYRQKVNLGNYAPIDGETDSNRGFHIGYAYSSDRYLDGEISEVRIWNRVLTPEEINAENHFYEVDPASEGLVTYWKFDDGGGNIVKDHTSNGNDATAGSMLTWTKVTIGK